MLNPEDGPGPVFGPQRLQGPALAVQHAQIPRASHNERVLFGGLGGAFAGDLQDIVGLSEEAGH
jgi:transcriptional regulator of acetoin/glycerol metabolism